MEELLLKLTQAINDFNKYLKNEYSSINKNFSGIANSIGDYSIFTLVVPKLTDFKINKTFPRANYILVSIDDPTQKVYLSVNALTKEKLAFRDGSKFEGIFSDLFLTYDFTGISPMPRVQIYIGYNSKYNPITAVKIADIDSSNPLPISVDDQKPVKYLFKSYGGNINNQFPTFVFSETNIASIIISNNSQNGTLYIGNTSDFDGTNYQTYGMPILAGEKFSMDFNPLAKDNISFKMGTPDNVDYSIMIKYKQTLF